MYPEFIVVRSYRDSFLLSLQKLRPLIKEIYSYLYLQIHRATFYSVLYDEATKLRVNF